MEAKHLIDWFVRKEGNYVLYGCEKGKKTPIRVENPQLIRSSAARAGPILPASFASAIRCR